MNVAQRDRRNAERRAGVLSRQNQFRAAQSLDLILYTGATLPSSALRPAPGREG